MKILFVVGYGGILSPIIKSIENLGLNSNEIFFYTSGLNSFNESRKNFKESKILSKEIILKDFLHSDFSKEGFEFNSSDISLIDEIISDRAILQFTHPQLYGKQLNIYEIANLRSHFYNSINSFISNNKIECIITTVVADMATVIIESISQSKSIPFYVIDSTRFPDNMSAFKDRYQDQMLRFKNVKDSNNSLDAEITLPSYVNLSNGSWRENNNSSSRFFSVIKSQIRFLKEWKFYRNNFGMTSKNSFLFFYFKFGQRIKQKIIFFIRNQYFHLALKKQKSFKENQKYYLYALHIDPEASTSVFAPEYIDQEYIIKQIRLYMPLDRILLVKEHPAMFANRNIGFFKKLSIIPGIEFLHPDVSSHEAIINSSLVISITGTILFESNIYDVPSFGFKTPSLFQGIESISTFSGNFSSLGNELRAAECKIINKQLLKSKELLHSKNSVDLSAKEYWNGKWDDPHKIRKLEFLLNEIILDAAES